ncbi:transcription elongation factor GreA [Candidatus Dojkabacteria bacterium]|uniref:Transcription elongation factor GreA n=1 Tax=Candidatus Dojkabacteria bacterium TaxID=2099670 RepID=A0A955RKV4_9BACT|nr:transcription elongation factor GreA [Candidatus Dojkabacteria bacterium]
MDDNKVILTADGLQELKDELSERVNVTRSKIADDIKLARDQGDLSENAAYKAAMESKDFNENRIDELEKLIKNAVVKKANPKNDKIDLGESVLLVNKDTGKEMKYTIVGSNEADPTKGKISLDSPIGEAVMGKKYGDVVDINLPTGTISFEIKRA